MQRRTVVLILFVQIKLQARWYLCRPRSLVACMLRTLLDARTLCQHAVRVIDAAAGEGWGGGGG